MKKSYHLILSFLLVLLNVSQANAQEELYILEGTVFDKEADMPLPYANVFLANTTYGVASDQEGRFKLEVPQKGPYTLVVRYVGYLPFKQQVTLNENEPFQLNIKLEVDVVQEETVVVTGYRNATYYEKDGNKVYTRGAEWKSYLKQFEANFIGTSEYASACKILNPEVLEFEVHDLDSSFKAAASEPLIIENRALGYQIEYTLEKFHLSQSKMTSQYAGYPFFREMEPRNEKQRQRWKRNRWRVYRGSLRQFLTAYYQNELEQKAFEAQMFDLNAFVRRYDVAWDPSVQPSNFYGRFTADQFLWSKQYEGAKSLKFDGILLVTDGNNVESREYRRPRQHQRFFGVDPDLKRRYLQRSWIQIKEGKSIEVASNGYVYNPLDFTVFGYWAYERVSELLPYYFDQESMNDQ